jgi:predicted dehydrogenase
LAAAAASAVPSLTGDITLEFKREVKQILSYIRGSRGAAGKEFKRKIKVGIVGNGGRGAWLAWLFEKHGGFEVHAVADYFPEVSSRCGAQHGVHPSRRFSTLSGYKRVLESGVEAVALETPPYFLAEMGNSAVEAGKHVYMAKPVAADVPSALAVRAAGLKATQKKQCFLVDYQIPTEPGNQEVVKRIVAGGIGPITQIQTIGFAHGFPDPPKTANLESRLQNLTWVNDIAMGGDYIGNYDIHAIDAALWVLGRNPVSAFGHSRRCRPEPHGDAHDACSVVFEYADGLVHNHCGQAFKNQMYEELTCWVYGTTGFGALRYYSKAQLKSFDDAYSADVENLYEEGAIRNVDKFYRNITEGHFENETVERAVQGAIVCILGREAAANQTRVFMTELLKAPKRLEVDLTGLKT